MKKIIALFAFAAMLLMSLTSCVTGNAAVCDEPTVDVVVRYGTPYYYNGAIVYYVYDGYYYYPHYNGSRWYYYRDKRPIRQHHRGWVNPGTQRPHKPNGGHHSHGNWTVKPNRGSHHGNGGHISRPNGGRPSGSGRHSGSGGRPSTPRRR